MEANLPGMICVGLILVLFVVPYAFYIEVTERRARREHKDAVAAGRHQPVTIQPFVELGTCMGSGACVTACPEAVLKIIDGQAVAVNMSACVGHGVCVPACPVDAIELVFGSEKRGIDIPSVDGSFETNVKGLFVAGELGGMGLIANAADQGVRAMKYAGANIPKGRGHDVAVVGAGPAGIAAGLAAKKAGLDYVVLEQEELGGALLHYPRKKLVFMRAIEFPLYGSVNLSSARKEHLVDLFKDVVDTTGLQVHTNERVDGVTKKADGVFELKTSTRTVEARRVVLALGRRGTPRTLGVPGEGTEKVSYSLLEPDQYTFDHILVVGGGDSAVEAACTLGEQDGNKVYMSYRGAKINRPKRKNVQRLREAVKQGQVELILESNVSKIGEDRVIITQQGDEVVIPNDYVFVFVGGVLPTNFLKEAGVSIKTHFGKRVVDAEEKAPSASPPPPPVRSPPAAIDEVPIARPAGEPLAGEATVARPALDAAPPMRPSQRHPSRPRRSVFDEKTRALPDGPPPLSPAPPPQARPTSEAATRALPQADALQAEIDDKPHPMIAPKLEPARLHLAVGAFDSALEQARDAVTFIERSARHLTGIDAARARRQIAELQSAAYLGLGDTESAMNQLDIAATAARTEGSPEAASRALLALGLAVHKAGQRDRATQTLTEAAHGWAGDPLGRATVLRLLGELALHAGDVTASEVHWGEALAVARQSRATGAALRAQGGQALVLAIGGELFGALDLLAGMSETRGAAQDASALARVLACAAEVENAMGLFAPALQRVERLVELVNHNELASHRPDALALLSETLVAIGMNGGAAKAASQAVDLGRARGGPRSISPRLRAARTLCELGRFPEAQDAVHNLPTPIPSQLDDPEGQLLAVRARIEANSRPRRGQALASEALDRPPALLPLATGRIHLDAAHALITSDHNNAARVAVKRALKLVQGIGARGLKFELLLAFHEAVPDHRVAEAAARTALAISEQLSERAAESLHERAAVADVLRRWEASQNER